MKGWAWDKPSRPSDSLRRQRSLTLPNGHSFKVILLRKYPLWTSHPRSHSHKTSLTSPSSVRTDLFRANWAVDTFVLQPVKQSILMSFHCPDFMPKQKNLPLSFHSLETKLIVHHAPDTVLSMGNSFLHSFIHLKDIYWASSMCQAMYMALWIQLSMTEKTIPVLTELRS